MWIGNLFQRLGTATWIAQTSKTRIVLVIVIVKSSEIQGGLDIYVSPEYKKRCRNRNSL